jgi:GrpB-like predicted nucleotidyltransferase (UPF0157 family)
VQVVISPPRDEWPREFDELAARLSEGLGALALRIDHIGSTAVPGLQAKDVIDVQVIVRSLEPRAEIVAAFESLGLPQRADGIVGDHVPPDWEGDESAWAKLLIGRPADERPSNIHVRAAGSPNERYALLFRDFLRANDRARPLGQLQGAPRRGDESRPRPLHATEGSGDGRTDGHRRGVGAGVGLAGPAEPLARLERGREGRR